jgi:hypothetical protein
MKIKKKNTVEPLFKNYERQVKPILGIFLRAFILSPAALGTV